MSSALPPLKWLPSPNFSGRTEAVRLIVLHDCEGGYQPSINWFRLKHSEVSAHLVMREDGGEVTQMVDLDAKAWHVKAFNSCSVGLEMAGMASKGYGDNEWLAAARVCRFLLDYYDLPITFAHGGAGRGICRHYDLGVAGGGHSDPTTDPTIWARFLARLESVGPQGDTWAGLHDES